MNESSPRIVALSVRPRRRGEPRLLDTLHLTPSSGVDGDHGSSSRRQVTILAEEAWEATVQAVGQELPWTTRRANVLVRGLDLSTLLVGGRLVLGACSVEILGETFPCDQMEEACAGLHAALLPETRGGVYGRILEEGHISVGDEARIERPGERRSLP
ncbi:MAG: MOSC domain-containing protein [Planctomycetota bacterium]